MILMMDLKVLKSRWKPEKVYFACCIKFAFENKTIALKSSKILHNIYVFPKINGNKNLKAADETLLQANETLKGVAEMIYKMDDTMTQEEENLCQRANQLRRKSEVTFKTIDPTK